jgi:site-specific DNA recombinase
MTAALDRPAEEHPRLALMRSRGADSGGKTSDVIRAAFCGRTSTEDRQDPTLSLPRQLRSSRLALPDGVVIVAFFYDVESGRKELVDRGHGRAHEQFDIPIRRDGGIQDLLAEAERPDRRFDVVICESVDRISRRTYLGTQIEHTLEQAGVPLLASDEPIALSGRRATQTLTRRVKQGISEWYVMEMLEKSRGGTEVHIEEGFNIGKPPYGYAAERIPHPVPARREEGKFKSRLVPDPDQRRAVEAIFAWRVGRQLGYKTIAAELNADPGRYPPPVPTDPARAVGHWTQSSVSEIVRNPKYTGYMVWNRRARKTGHGKPNPVSEWVWSPEITHPALVSRETFVAAQKITDRRARVRGDAGRNQHPQTRRTYRLRSYVFCALCGRRMCGKSRHADDLYYGCQPAGVVPEGHPKSLWVSEPKLVAGVYAFFAKYVFGPNRRQLLAQQHDGSSDKRRQQEIASIRRKQDDIAARRKRLVRSLELTDDPDGDLVRDVNARLAELRVDSERLADQAAGLEGAVPELALLDSLPVADVDLARLPDAQARALFDAFRLEVRYDRAANVAHCQVTVSAKTRLDPVTFCVVPPVGVEPTLRPF